MKLTMRFKEISEEDKLALEKQAERYCLRIFRTADEAVLQAEGSYSEMLGIIILTSCLSHTEITLRK